MKKLRLKFYTSAYEEWEAKCMPDKVAAARGLSVSDKFARLDNETGFRVL
jgi:hypothetical protein